MSTAENIRSIRGHWTDYALLVGLAAMFGASFIFTKIAVQEIAPLTIVAIRLAIAAVVLYLAARLAGQELPAVGPIWWTIGLAALTGSALPFFLISWGQQRIDAGLAAILMAVMPLITLVLAHFFTDDEKLNAFKIAGFILGLFGVGVLIGLDKLADLGNETILRQYALMGAACCYAVNAIITKKLVELPRRATAAALILSAFVMVLPFALVLDVPWQIRPTANAIGAVLFLGIAPTAIGTLLIFAIVKRQGAAFLSQINFLVPVFGVIWAVLFLSEHLLANALVALALILAGVAIARIQFNNSRKSRSRS